MHRGDHWDEYLSQKLQNFDTRREFLLSKLEGEDSLGLKDALRYVIERMGITEFSELSGIPASNIGDFVKGVRNPKPETLDIYLKPFGFKIKLGIEDLDEVA